MNTRPLQRKPCTCVKDGRVDVEKFMRAVAQFVELGEEAEQVCPQAIFEALAGLIAYRMIEYVSLREAMCESVGTPLKIEYLGDVFNDTITNICAWFNEFAERMEPEKDTIFNKKLRLNMLNMDMSISYARDKSDAGAEAGKDSKGHSVRRGDDRLN